MIEGKPPTSKNITKKYLAKKQPTYGPRINQKLYSMRICCFMSMFSLTLSSDQLSRLSLKKKSKRHFFELEKDAKLIKANSVLL